MLSGKKRNILSIQIKVDLYEVFLSGIIYCLLFYFKTILTPFYFPPYFWYLSHWGKGVQKVLATMI